MSGRAVVCHGRGAGTRSKCPRMSCGMQEQGECELRSSMHLLLQRLGGGWRGVRMDRVAAAGAAWVVTGAAVAPLINAHVSR